MTDVVTAHALPGVPEIAAGSDLAEVLGDAIDAWGGLLDGDIVAVTSKVVSKAEGRVLDATSREDAIAAETESVVARRGPLTIARTRHGLVLAAAGVDASNTPDGTVLLLPVDPDASAEELRRAWSERFGVRIGVLITDTLGRAWRVGQVDAAIGAAGVRVIDDLRGSHDTHGRELTATMTAVGDAVAAVADLVKGKTSARPVAVVRGLGSLVEAGQSAADLVRPAAEDLFAVGAAEAAAAGARDALTARRTVREWTDAPVDHAAIARAVSAALTAPAPHSSAPWRFHLLDDRALRKRLLDTMAQRWRADLAADGADEAAIERRVARGELLRRAPALLVPVVDLSAAHAYPDDRRARAERDMFVLSMGAAIEALLVALAMEGLGTAWVSSTLFCADDVRDVLGLAARQEPMGAVAIGHPLHAPVPRDARAVDDHLVIR